MAEALTDVLIEDDPDDHVAFEGRRIAKARAACVMHLADLKQFELWPDEVANTDVDRFPTFRHAPPRATFSSPAGMCAEIAGPL